MAVYIDPLMQCVPSKAWPWPESCHLFADTLEELHAFARRIGLKREWFQHRPGKLPHYDLTRRRRAMAIVRGVRQVERREAVEIWRRLRSMSDVGCGMSDPLTAPNRRASTLTFADGTSVRVREVQSIPVETM